MRRDMLFMWNNASLTHPDTAFKTESVGSANHKSGQLNGRATANTNRRTKYGRLIGLGSLFLYFNSKER
jgi:hypothetical protein